jgi:hypothetical protein
MNDLEHLLKLQATPNLYRILCPFNPVPESEIFQHGWIQVSTTQAPVFDARMQHSIYNFRRLGPLNCIPFLPTFLDFSSFDFTREVVAVNPNSSISEVQELKSVFHLMGLPVQLHFIIVFEAVSDISYQLPHLISGACTCHYPMLI